MAKRTKKPPVTPEQTADWLNRNDQCEPAPQIAKKDGYDVRTVRSHLQKAKQERERNEARATVLRKALEDHYLDLCNFAFRLDPTNSPTTVFPPLPADDNIIEAALRQHIPRSPIWNLRIKKEKLEQEYNEFLNKIKGELEQNIPENPALKKMELELSGVSFGISLFLTSHIERQPHLDTIMKISEYLQIVPDGDGFQLQLGFSRLHFFEKIEDAEQYLEILRSIVDKLEQNIKDSHTFQDLTDNYSELSRVKNKLHEEISIIRMRRIVPGRCKFCPL